MFHPLAYLKEYNCTPDDCNIIIGYCYNYEESCKPHEMTLARLKDMYNMEVDMPVCQIGATIGVDAGPYSIGYGVVHRSGRI